MKTLGVDGIVDNIVIARYYHQILRSGNGELYYNKNERTEIAVPLEWVFAESPIDCLPFNLKFPYLQDEFPLGIDVIMLTPFQEKEIRHLNGSVGIVHGFSSEKRKPKVEVFVIRPPL